MLSSSSFLVARRKPPEVRGPAVVPQPVRELVPDHFLLVPGVGAQGGDLEAVARAGMNDHCGLLVNSSRGIIYAGKGTDFASRAAEEAGRLQRQMSTLLEALC